MIARRYLVRGSVQGVGFRWFVMREAGKLGLEGFVQNLPDGSVEVLARGPLESVSQLEVRLARGPGSARVDGVEKYDVSHDINLPKHFTVM